MGKRKKVNVPPTPPSPPQDASATKSAPRQAKPNPNFPLCGTDLREILSGEVGSKGRRPQFSSSFSLLPYPRGIFNRRFYCYMNAVIQTLIFCPPFVHLIVSVEESSLSAQCPIITALGKWFKDYWKPGYSRASILPPSLVLPRVFTGQVQSDAQEYLQCLLEAVDAELMEAESRDVLRGGGNHLATNIEEKAKELKGWTVVEGKGRLRYQLHKAKHSVLLNTILGGITESYVSAGNSSKDQGSSVTVEGFFMLSLKIGFKAQCTIEESLLHTFSPEKIESTEEAGGKTIVKTTKVGELPRILILHLSRWAVTREGDIVKIDNKVQFGNTLAFPPSICTRELSSLPASQRSYRLLAAVAHRGHSSADGHYVAYIAAHIANPFAIGTAAQKSHQDPFRSTPAPGTAHSFTSRTAITKGTFILCDDVRVTLEKQSSLEKETVYFLVYQKVE